MAMKGYSAFPKAPALLEPHHQIVYCHIQDTRRGGSYPSAEEESVYSTAPADWAIIILFQKLWNPVQRIKLNSMLHIRVDLFRGSKSKSGSWWQSEQNILHTNQIQWRIVIIAFVRSKTLGQYNHRVEVSFRFTVKLISRKMYVTYNQVALKMPVPSLMPKLNSNETIQYLSGWPLNQSR